MAGHGPDAVRLRLRRVRRLWPAVAGMVLGWPGGVGSEPPEPPPFPPRSGYEFARPETRAIQDDAFANPGLFWIERGAELWTAPAGPGERSCQACHGAEAAMAGVAATYPKFDDAGGRLVNLEQRINLCRTRHAGAEPYPPESDPLLSLSAYVTRQSAGAPLRVRIDGPARPWFERGRALYRERVGQMNLACTPCDPARRAKASFMRTPRRDPKCPTPLGVFESLMRVCCGRCGQRFSVFSIQFTGQKYSGECGVRLCGW